MSRPYSNSLVAVSVLQNTIRELRTIPRVPLSSQNMEVKARMQKGRRPYPRMLIQAYKSTY
jgi:hypothetical protein